MAIIKLGATVVGIRGTIDGITYSANKAGPHAKGWTRGANPKTDIQTNQRNRQSFYATNWRSLSGALRTAWNTWAALPAQARTNSLGVSYQISGFAWYVLLNTNLQNANDLAITAVPVLPIPVAPTLSNLNLHTTAFGFNCFVRYGAADPDLGKKAPILCRIVNSVGRTAIVPKLLLIVGQPTALARDVIFTTELNTRFGTISIGQRGFLLSCYQNAEGRRSPFTAIAGNVII